MCEQIPYLKCDITPGSRTVIEAAAGTGKTYNITNIVVRMILERDDISIDNMVIGTVTRAAAGELKERISTRLSELEQALAADRKDELLQHAFDHGVSKEDLKKRLRLALLNFDRAMIGTIHSFAMRCLSENGFDSHLKFGFTLNENTPALIDELCNDFCRSLTYREEDICLQGYFEKKKVFKYVKNLMADPGLTVCWQNIPQQPSDIPLADIYAKVVKECAELQQQQEALQAELDSIKPHLTAAEEALKDAEKKQKEASKIRKKLKAKKYDGTPEKIQAEQELCEADKVLAEAQKQHDCIKKCSDECASQISTLQKKKTDADNSISRAICERAYAHVAREYKRICEEKNILGNDDLILKMCEALHNPVLVTQLQKKFPVGLIDEFQDTNTSQFEIFEKIFLENPGSTFFVVGDPRQAIYRFRNCDIETYLTAKEAILSEGGECFSMNTNRRSGAKYIAALNDIFMGDDTFAMPDMSMPEQFAPEPPLQVLLKADGTEVNHPIEGFFDDSKNYEAMYETCASDICKLLNSNYQLPAPYSRPVECGDIAVLTNTSWKNIIKFRDILQKKGVPVRMMKNPNVFATSEAETLATFLDGVLNPGSNDVLLRALITPLSDLELSELKSEKNIEIRAALLQGLNHLWHERSFMIMYNELFIKFNVTERLLKTAGGERALSNYNTIADILCEKEFAAKLTPGALLRLLRKEIELSKEDNNNNPGRPETDRGAVLIDTICGSKGLSYPIVFLPDLFYTGKSLDSDQLTRMFHDAGKLCYSPFEHKANELKEKNELFQENLRKAYVAFTRAKYYCRFYCGKNPKGLAATDWLFRSHDITEPQNAYGQQTKIKNAPWTDAFPCNELLGDIPDKYTPPVSEEALRRPDLMPYLVSQSGFLSFSSITPHGGSQSTLALDREDETDVEPEENSREDKKAPATVFPTMELPAGTTFGNAIHAIMEECDYKADCDTLALHVQEQGLREDTTVQETAKMLFNVLNAPIPACDGGTFKLSETDPLKKKCEFDFLYEFGSKFRTKELFAFAKNYFEKKFNLSCPDFTDESTTFDNGFFNGSIDLFFQQDGKFYIVDWKTNKLASIKHYSESALPCAMADSRYYLQYMIYTIALFKYLRERLPAPAGDEELYNSCFGGVRYIFLRGTYEKGHGIFSDRLSYDDLKKLEEIIG